MSSAWPERFWAKASPEPSTGCWIWTGTSDRGGYGMSREPATKKMRLAHRIAFELFKGRGVAAGLEIDHTCRNPRCVNPLHLREVTHDENIRAGRRATATACLNGHPYSEDNTYRTGRGHRRCRACNLAAALRYKAARREATR